MIMTMSEKQSLELVVSVTNINYNKGNKTFFWRCQPKRFFPAGQDFKNASGLLNKYVAVFFCHFGAKRFLLKARSASAGQSASPGLAIYL